MIRWRPAPTTLLRPVLCLLVGLGTGCGSSGPPSPPPDKAADALTTDILNAACRNDTIATCQALGAIAARCRTTVRPKNAEPGAFYRCTVHLRSRDFSVLGSYVAEDGVYGFDPSGRQIVASLHL